MPRKLIELVWQPLRQKFKENDAESIHVRTSVEPGRVGGDLFGTHVSKRAQQLTGLGSPRGGEQFGRGDMGHAEVEHLWLAGVIHKDVARLQVAMNDTLVMSVLHRVAHLRQQLQARSRVQSAISRVLVHRHTANELHGEEGPAVHTDARFVHLRDTGMLQPRQDFCFVSEAAEQLGCCASRANHLESNGAARVVLFGLVNGPHATFAVSPQDAVAADESRQPGLRCNRKCGAGGGHRAGQEVRVAFDLRVESEKILHSGA